MGHRGDHYPTEPVASAPTRMAPGVRLGCGFTTVRDFDSTHRAAVRYRLIADYTAEDGSGSRLEGESTIRPSSPDVLGIVINEFRSRGPRGDQDQFIELRNVPDSPITARGWFLQTSTRSYEVNPQPIASIDGVTINPGCHYLLAAMTSGTYSGSVPGEGQMLARLQDTIGLALRTSGGQVVDQVGMGNNTAYKEGVSLGTVWQRQRWSELPAYGRRHE